MNWAGGLGSSSCSGYCLHPKMHSHAMSLKGGKSGDYRLLLGLGGAQAVEELGGGHALLLEAAEEAAVQCSLNRGRRHAQLSRLLYCPLACMHAKLTS